MNTTDSSRNRFAFFSLIPEFKEESGHHVHYHTAIGKAITSLDGEFSVYINCRSKVDFSPSWKKWFRRRRKWKYKLIDPCTLFLDFSKLFLSKSSSKRIFFLESFAQVDLVTLLLAAILFAKKEDRLWILFRMPFKHSFLFKMLKKRLMILSDSELLSKLHKTELLEHYPFEPPAAIPRGKKIACAWLGAPRKEKGLEAIQKLMQLPDPAAAGFCLAVSEQMQFSSTNALEVTIFRASLPRAIYEEEFAKAEIFFLPYEPASYQWRTSGIFIEAILAGKIPLVRDNTWAANQLRQHHLEELIADWEDSQFFTNLLHILNNNQIMQKLALLQAAFREQHSPNSLQQALRQLIK